MRVTIQAPIDAVNEQPPGIQILGSIERDDIRMPASSLGFFLRETHALLRQSSASNYPHFCLNRKPSTHEATR